MNQFLKETYYFDYSHPSIQNLIEEFKGLSEKEKTAQFFIKVRDGWRYNPYEIFTSKEDYKASVIVNRELGHCIDKSTIYIAGLRAMGIPARLRLAKVVNHIAAERLSEKLGTNHIAPHGVVEVFVSGSWFKVSTAFNSSLCEKYDVDPLVFDGTSDAMLQPYNRKDEKYMEYIEDYGFFEDVPLEFIIDTFMSNYPQLAYKLKKGRFTI
jgi:transglutaminase-like putative cysteine protease